MSQPDHSDHEGFSPKKVTRPFLLSILCVITLFIVSSSLFATRLHAIRNQQIEQIREQVIQTKKDALSIAVNRTIDDIKNEKQTFSAELTPFITTGKLLNEPIVMAARKERAMNRIRQTRLKDNEYIWVNEIINYDGGDAYAIRRVHPNLPETEGKILSTAQQDLKGNLPYLKELTGIKQNGEIFFTYWFKKLGSDEIAPKIAYAKLYPEFDWVIASGMYLDDVDTLVLELSKNATSSLYRQLYLVLSITSIALLIALGVTMAARKKILAVTGYYINQVASREKELQGLNETLETRIQERTRKLSASEENLRITLDSIAEGVIATDTAGRIIRMNPIAEEITGWSVADAMGEPAGRIISMVNAQTSASIENPIDKVLRSGEAMGMVFHASLIAKNGAVYKIANSSAPIRHPSGQIAGAVLVFRDISEEYRIQDELQKIHNLESVGTLAGGIAHDFNNILMGLFGNIEQAKLDLKQDHPSYQHLLTAEQSLDRAVRLTFQLLTFSKGGVLVKENIRLPELVKKLAAFDLSGSATQPVFDIAEDLWRTDVDKGQIQQVFSNLIINANQSMPNGGHIHISMQNATVSADALPTRPKGNYLKIIIRDEGTGIAPKNIKHIFDPYFTTKSAGTGLGLATVYAIINKHEGFISADSTPNSGTSFTIYLPASSDQTRPKAVPEQTVIPPTQTTGSILIMDDEEAIRNVINRMLTRLGYTATEASDGEEAIELYKKAMESRTPYDAVIMDLTIPGGMNGKDAVRVLLDLDPKAKAIISSGYASDPIMAQYEKYGFKGVVMKPYNMHELQEILQRVLGQE